MTAFFDGPQTGKITLAFPLVALAPWAGRLAMLTLPVALVAAGSVYVGNPLLALAAAVVAATLLVVAGLSLVATRMQARSRSVGAQILAAGLGDDPDPVLVTDRSGQAMAVNRAGADRSLTAERLIGWSATPDCTFREMLGECLRRGHATREYSRKTGVLRVSAHVAHQAGELIVWRFCSLETGSFAGAAALPLPLVSLADGALDLNRAARELLKLGDAEPGELAVVFDPLKDLESRSNEAICLRLPDGRDLWALRLPDKDGQTAWVLLREPALPSLDLASGGGALAGFEGIPVALLSLDAEGAVVESNRLARSLLGLDSEETYAFWEVVEGLGRPVSDWLDDARAGRALGRPEVLRATRTADETFVQIILRRAHSGTGENALVAVISDATELKSLEARFVQSQKMQAIGQLAGGVAHDFNNLLTAISGHCDLLLINRDRYDPDYNDLLQIHQNANRAAALVRQLLAFSRKQTLKPETFHLEGLLEDLTHLLTRFVGERITLELDHDPDLPPIRADRRQLEQVIMNLVVNARDAMPMGGTIRITTRALHLDAELARGRARVAPGDYATIDVIDQGVGIAPGNIEKMFEPFFTTKKMGEGTGLGLSTAYGIVKQMGGYIFADSVEGTGTTFTLYFATQPGLGAGAPRKSPGAVSNTPASGASNTPMPDAEPLSEAASEGRGDHDTADISAHQPSQGTGSVPVPAFPEAAVSGGVVLLVEDEAPVRAFAARALRLQGYQVFEAQDGEEALDFLSRHDQRIDIFVTDVIMPGIDGPGWVRKALVDRPQIPVVFISGYTEATVRATLGRIPRAVFLGKPFSLKDLSDTIAGQLQLETV